MRLPRTTLLPAVAVALAGSAVLACSTARAADDPDARARKIVSQMTLDEKIQELHGVQSKTEYRVVPGVPRLGIPEMTVTNGPAGVGNGGPGHQGPATALPAPISLAATWDINAARTYGEIAGSEARELANSLLEAPDVNIVRIPQNGRTFESYSEDPYLAGQMAVAAVQGIQSQGEIANVKHYDGNNQETHRTTESDDIDERTLREIYLPAFEAAVKEGHVGSLMGAYNKVNGVYCCQNDILLNKILKQDWGFDGFVTSDFGAVHSTVATALAGLDVEMPTGHFWGDALKAKVTSGDVPMAVIDDKLVRRFRTMMRLGVFDTAPQNSPIPVKANGAKERLLAEEGMVLLKNAGGLLPLNPAHIHTIALIGSDRASTGGGGEPHVRPAYTVAPLKGLQDRAGAGVTVQMDDGKDPVKAAALARASDIAIVMVGDHESEGRDHPIALSDADNALVAAVADANPHTVLVLKSGSALLMPWLDKVPAILQAWYPGEEDGNAVAAVLFGDFDPSGKLPITYPRRMEDLVANTPEQYPGVGNVVHYSEGVFVGYRSYDERKIEPLFPFGFGLSYTTFTLANLKVSPGTIPAAAAPVVNVDLDVSNTGTRAGAEVVQVYVGMPSTAAVPEPPRQLKGFQRTQLDPGASGHVHITLDARSFSYWDVGIHGWKIMPGTYSIQVGESSRDIRLQGQVVATP